MNTSHLDSTRYLVKRLRESALEWRFTWGEPARWSDGEISLTVHRAWDARDRLEHQVTIFAGFPPGPEVEGLVMSLRKAGQEGPVAHFRTDRHGQFRLQELEPWEYELRFEASLAELMIALRDGEGPARAAAASALGRLGAAAAPAISALVDALRDSQDSARAAAAEALGRLGDQRAIPALVQSLRDPSADVRGRSAGALGEIGGPAAVAIPKLLETLHDPESLVRATAVEALGRIRPLGTPALLARLNELDRDLSDTVRRAAARARSGIEVGTQFFIKECATERHSDVFHSEDGTIDATLLQTPSGHVALRVEIALETVPDRLAHFQLTDREGHLLVQGFLGLFDAAGGKAFGEIILDALDRSFRFRDQGIYLCVEPQSIHALTETDRLIIERSSEATAHLRCWAVLDEILLKWSGRPGSPNR